MPSVKPKESLSSFLDRAVPLIISDEGMNPRQAVIRGTEVYRQPVKATEALVLGGIGDLDEIQAIDDFTYEKEIMYPGNFTKEDFSFSTDKATVDHWAGKVKEFNDAEIEIPITSEHSEAPEARLGSIVGASVKKDSRGRDGLFVKMKFVDKESAKIGLKNQVSLYSPAKYKDSRKVEHVYPIRHVAVTSYPVVTKLDGYTPIAASFSKPQIEDVTMVKILELADGIGLKLSEKTSEDAASKAILDEVKGLKDRVTSLEAVKAELDTLELSFKGYKAANPPKAAEIPVSDAMLKIVEENRELKLSQLVQHSNISPVVKQKMLENFCTKDGISLVLSQNHNDGFDTFIDIMAENNIVELGGKTGPQTLTLSKSDAEKLKGTENDPYLLVNRIPSK
tara:strand:+ start:3391 stop:4572 length:1182 start_codon:yes stop_codon:yes gene_type:complete